MLAAQGVLAYPLLEAARWRACSGSARSPAPHAAASRLATSGSLTHGRRSARPRSSRRLQPQLHRPIEGLDAGLSEFRGPARRAPDAVNEAVLVQHRHVRPRARASANVDLPEPGAPLTRTARGAPARRGGTVAHRPPGPRVLSRPGRTGQVRRRDRDDHTRRPPRDAGHEGHDRARPRAAGPDAHPVRRVVGDVQGGVAQRVQRRGVLRPVVQRGDEEGEGALPSGCGGRRARAPGRATTPAPGSPAPAGRSAPCRPRRCGWPRPPGRGRGPPGGRRG